MIALAIILFFAVLIWDLITDYKKWLKNRDVNHSKEGWVRFLLLSPSIALFTIYHPGQWAWVLVCVLLMEFFVYSNLFDGIYNKLRGFDWWFTGSNEGKSDAMTDRFWRMIGKFWTQIIKISGVVIWVTVYIISL